MVIATYSITAPRLPKVTFGGPYIITHQDIMVRNHIRRQHLIEPALEELDPRVGNDGDLAFGVEDLPRVMVRPFFR